MTSCERSGADSLDSHALRWLSQHPSVQGVHRRAPATLPPPPPRVHTNEVSPKARLKHQQWEQERELSRQPPQAQGLPRQACHILGELAEVPLPDVLGGRHVHLQVRADEHERGELRGVDVGVGEPTTKREDLLDLALVRQVARRLLEHEVVQRERLAHS